MDKPRTILDDKVDELNAWVDGAFKDHLQVLFNEAQRRSRIQFKLWQGMGTTFLDFDGDNEYRRPGDSEDLMDLLEKAAINRDDVLWNEYPELLQFLSLIYDLDEAFSNWVVGDMEPTVPPKGKRFRV